MTRAAQLRARVHPKLGRPLTGVWYRAIGYDALQGGPPDAPEEPDPLWDQGARQKGARYTPMGPMGFACLYLGDRVDFAVVESAGIGTGGTAAPFAPTAVVSVRVELHCVLDLTDVATRHALGVDLDALIAPDWALVAEEAGSDFDALPLTQRLGHVVACEAGFDGLRVPSSLDPLPEGARHANLIVLTDHLVGTASAIEIVQPSLRFRRVRLP